MLQPSLDYYVQERSIISNWKWMMFEFSCQEKDCHSLTHSTSSKQEIKIINWKETKLWNEIVELHYVERKGNDQLYQIKRKWNNRIKLVRKQRKLLMQTIV